jgi:hypothetical protein
MLVINLDPEASSDKQATVWAELPSMPALLITQSAPSSVRQGPRIEGPIEGLDELPEATDAEDDLKLADEADGFAALSIVPMDDDLLGHSQDFGSTEDFSSTEDFATTAETTPEPQQASPPESWSAPLP